MAYYVVLLKLILLILVEQGTGQFYIGFNAGVSSCPNFKNDKLDGDNMKLAQVSGDDDDAMCLEGYLYFSVTIDEGYLLSVEIFKETDMASELMFSCSMDVCESIKDTDAPWAPLFEAMNITSCPIPSGKYEVAELCLGLGFCKDVLNHNYVGDYRIKMQVGDGQMEKVSCHKLSVFIKEQ